MKSLEWNINSLWSFDPIWPHKPGSTLLQVMACCLQAWSRYLNHHWGSWHLSLNNLMVSAHGTILHLEFEKYTFKYLTENYRSLEHLCTSLLSLRHNFGMCDLMNSWLLSLLPHTLNGTTSLFIIHKDACWCDSSSFPVHSWGSVLQIQFLNGLADMFL